MEMNFTVIAIAALVPLVMGFLWYNPKTFGNIWMRAAGMTEENMKGANMAKIFILTYIFSFMAAMMLQTAVIHQFSIYSILMNEPGFNDPNSEISAYLTSFMEKYGTNFRTFKHGALHGALTGIFLILPVLGINAMFERKNISYIAVNTGFWVVCLALMGGILCAFI